MAETLVSRFKHAWNAFMDRDSPSSTKTYTNYGFSSARRPDRKTFSKGNERTIVTSVYNRIAMDCASIRVEHVRLDEQGRYLESIQSGLNNCLTTEANIDQTGRGLIQDIVMSMFDEGVVAVVPVDTVDSPLRSMSTDILTLRTGKITAWYPNHVRILLYNDRTGKKEEITLPKKTVAIIENPLYSIINEPNSVMQRLIRKLSLMDTIDEESSAGKLDLIIQLPYVVKSEARKKQAEERRQDIERQLSGTKYGIAYTDGSEHITQLNRSLENNLLKQVEYLTDLLFSQLGMTTDVLNGTANETTMMNYRSRIIEPILSSIVDEFKRKFLTKTARTQKQSIMFFSEPFKLIPVSSIAEIADKFTRNEILSSNEVRQIIGMKPSADPKADELRNKNLNESNSQIDQNNGMYNEDPYYDEEDYDY